MSFLTILSVLHDKVKFEEWKENKLDKAIEKAFKPYLEYMISNPYTSSLKLKDVWYSVACVVPVSQYVAEHSSKRITMKDDPEGYYVWSQVKEFANIHYDPKWGSLSVNTGFQFFGGFTTETIFDKPPDPKRLETLFKRKMQAQIDNIQSSNSYKQSVLKSLSQVDLT